MRKKPTTETLARLCDAGFSRAEIADLIGCSEGAVNRWLRESKLKTKNKRKVGKGKWDLEIPKGTPDEQGFIELAVAVIRSAEKDFIRWYTKQCKTKKRYLICDDIEKCLKSEWFMLLAGNSGWCADRWVSDTKREIKELCS